MKKTTILIVFIFCVQLLSAQEVFRVENSVMNKQEQINKYLKSVEENIKANKRNNYLALKQRNLVLTEGGFSEGLAVAEKNNSIFKGYVNEDLEWVLKPQYLEAKNFRNGKASVTTKFGNNITINKKGKRIKR